MLLFSNFRLLIVKGKNERKMSNVEIYSWCQDFLIVFKLIVLFSSAERQIHQC